MNPQDWVGRPIGPCVIEGLVGEGGMGLVFRARHTALDREVALKLLSPEFASRAGAAEALVAEARAAAKLEDPRIVQIYDVGLDNGVPFIVMQLLHGNTLAEEVAKNGPLAPKRAVELMKEVLLALQVAHRAGVVHRDIKPANIFLTREGGVKLMDFGLASTRDSSQGPVEAGSFDFMAPEQAAGVAADAKADLYSFGATFYYLLSGSPPFTGQTSGEILIKHRDEPVPDIRVRRREVTAGLAGLLMNLMAKSPDYRPATAEEVLKALGAANMYMELDSSGLPFKILPPPVEPKEGFIPPPPEPEPVVHSAEEEAAVPAAPRAEGPVPLPPPLPAAAARPNWISWMILIGLYACFFGAHWKGLSGHDWLGGGAFGACAATALILAGAAGALRKGAIAVGVLASASAPLVHATGGGWPAGLPMETLTILALGACLAGGALVLGVNEQEGDDWVAVGLLAGAFAALLYAAAAIKTGGLSPAACAASVRADLASLLSSGGHWRWGGLLALWASSSVLRSESRR